MTTEEVLSAKQAEQDGDGPMSDYAPTTALVRHNWGAYGAPREEFDRWLAAHDAEVREAQADYDAVRIDDLTTRLATAERLLAEQGEPEWEDIVIGREWAGEGHWSVTKWSPDVLESARTLFPHSEYRIGKWLPVKANRNGES